MAYGVKYELDFSDIKGNKRSVQILENNYSGEVLSMIGTDNPVIIKYTNDDDFYNPIIGSSCVLNLKRTDTITYDEFQNFDERQYKVRVNIGTEDSGLDINSPLWQLVEDNWEAADITWATGTVFQVYWEGFLVSDTFKEAIQSNPYDITLRAMDNLGTLDSYLIPDGNINLNTDSSIKTGATDQSNLDSAFYYIHEILKFTGLDFDIFVQNNIRKVNETGLVVTEGNNLFQDILINEFAFYKKTAKLNSKIVLENILRITNSRIYQANASWYIVSNSNYYDSSISGSFLGGVEGDNTIFTPSVRTDAVTNATINSVTLNGTILDDKGLAISERGFYFGTNPIIKANDKVPGNAATNFTSNQGTLTEGLTYFIMAYAKNNLFFEGNGSIIEFIPGESETTQPPSVVPVCQMQQPTNVNVQNDDMVFTGQFSDVGTSNVTSYGFYFGTNGNDFNKNDRYTIASGVNISVATAFVGDTDASPFNQTLTAGQVYYINAWAINGTGEGVSDMIEQYTFNAWELSKVSDSSKLNVPFNSNARGDSVYLSISSDNTDCYRIIKGVALPSLSGLATISGACNITPVDPDPSVEVSCVSIQYYSNNTPKDLCCNTPTPKEGFIDAEKFDDATKIYINSDCSTLLGGTKYVSGDSLTSYREWNGVGFGTKINCQSTSVDTCDPDVITPDVFLIENTVRGNRLYVTYNAAYSVGEEVRIVGDSEFCYLILEENRDIASAGTIQVSCNIVTTQPVEQCPTMSFFARYLKCGGDQIVIIGNQTDTFPSFIQQVSTTDCFSFIDRTGIPQTDDNFNLGCSPTNKFVVKDGQVKDFGSCDACTGVSTTTQVVVPSTTTTQAIFYRIYIEIQANCSDADQIIQVSNTTDSFPNVITDGLSCFRNQQAGGNGQNGDVDLFISFNNGDLATDCASCNSYISTTTTQAPTTTQPICNAISASVTTSALNACCGTKTTTIYIDANSISNASQVYTNSTCTTTLGAGNFIFTSGNLFFWNGVGLSAQVCPACP